jgi:hypothetical protein
VRPRRRYRLGKVEKHRRRCLGLDEQLADAATRGVGDRRHDRDRRGQEGPSHQMHPMSHEAILGPSL